MFQQTQKNKEKELKQKRVQVLDWVENVASFVETIPALSNASLLEHYLKPKTEPPYDHIITADNLEREMLVRIFKVVVLEK
ncbi:MAG TPA: hypothetical protein ENH85_01960 [Candidatus Scalindua sp.]|nr:hypothetical protein [Candidatus Scalindua sp.]